MSFTLYNYESLTHIFYLGSAVSIGFNPAVYTVLEGESVDLVIERVGDSEEPVIADLSTVDGTAAGKHVLFFCSLHDCIIHQLFWITFNWMSCK